MGISAKGALILRLKKILKLMFGQTAFIVLALLVQIGFFLSAGSCIMSDESFRAINLALRALSIILMIYILNKPGNPEFKLSWIIQIAVFPIYGSLFYLYVQGQKVPLLINKEHKRLRRQSASYIRQDPAVLEELADDPHKQNFVRYMNEYADVSAFKNTAVTYFSLGEEKWADMLAELEKAEKYIFLEYYIIEEGEMWDSILAVLQRKAARGVDVRLMYDGMGCLPKLPYGYHKKLREMGIRCHIFNPFRPFLSTIQNNRDHRKILVIDGKVAYTGGINLADEYVNVTAPYGHWKDTAVKLEGEAAFSFAVMFLELWQISTRQRLPDYEAFRPVLPEVQELPGYVIPFDESPFDGELVGETVYMDILGKAQRYVHITTPYMIIDNEMLTSLGNAAKSGIDVKVIVPHVADHWYAHAVAKAYYAQLIERGVQLYEYMPGFIHSKSFVSDDNTAVVGTINLDYRSLYLHFECGAWIHKHPVVQDIEEDFQRTLERCRPITLEGTRVRGGRRVVNALLRLIAPLM